MIYKPAFIGTLLLSLFFVPDLSGQNALFNEVSQLVGISRFGGSQGIAVGDYNNDGFDDFYISSDTGKNQLFRNNGDGTYSEVAEELGLDITAKTKTSIWGDINNDGYLDLYLANLRTNDQLFQNLGDGRFRDITVESGIWNTQNPSSVNMADVNNDGFLDIYVANFASENILYLNQKDLSFVDYTYASGALDKGSSMGSVFFDFDKDGDQDLYLVHDHAEPNFLYLNDGQGRFIEVGEQTGANVQGLGMGVDVGDINNDGYLDIYITNLFKNILLLNQGNGTFSNISKWAGIEDFGMGWGVSFLDFDKDGWLDIYVANDSDFSPEPNVLYQNNRDNTFSKVEWDDITNQLGQSYATACLDYNLDGQLDIAVANRGMDDHFLLFHNRMDENHWIGIKLIGSESNRGGVGSKIFIQDASGKVQYKELIAGHGWASQNSSILYFGLGTVPSLENLSIHWPSGLVQKLDSLDLNQYYTILEGADPIPGILSKPLNTSLTQDNEINPTINFQILPNPNSGSMLLDISTKFASPLQIDVFTLKGKLLFTQLIDHFSNRDRYFPIQLNGSSEENILFIRLSNEELVISKKLILEP